ncbi:MAG: DUF6438 domain-containing protein [Bacteroidetes bacterium]|nr:DUF6438 domain-containing protein [Bacteroidota bacterium]MDA0904393.1 DUF6438 domain-containing protein [Bacteroidota bacterium]MDA1243034.1 DUF6438 domain-containing protein [Bacteroidota bacterium]
MMKASPSNFGRPCPTRAFSWGIWGLLAVFGWVGCSGMSSTWAEDTVVVGLRRTLCFGGCPDYEFTLHGNGEATLRVGPFSEEVFGRHLEQGLHTASVDLKAWSDVLQLGETLGFDTLQARYDNPMVMDLPAAIITLEGQEVFNRYGGPNLNALYTTIERHIGATDWKADPKTAR